MTAVNRHEAKSRLSELVKAVEDTGELVVLCRNGVEVAEIRPRELPGAPRRSLVPDPALRVTPAADYDPAEPLREDEWPSHRC